MNDRIHPRPGSRFGLAVALGIAFGLAIVSLALYPAWQFPVFAPALTTGLAVYFVLLLIYPPAWLVVVPAAIPVLELGYWSGRVYFGEFDLLLMVTLGAVICRRGYSLTGIDRTAISVVAVLLIYNIWVTWNGLVPIAAGGLGLWNDQLSSLNSLREARGFFAALMFLPLLAMERNRGTDVAFLFSLGMVLGLVAVSFTILWERLLFTGLANFTDAYRVSGWFFGMTNGGAAIDAYLILATPFIGALILFRPNWMTWSIAGLVAGLAGYGLYVTYSRANYPAVAVMFMVFAVGAAMVWRGRFVFKARYAMAAVLLAVVGGAASYYLFVGTNIEKRFSRSLDDLRGRFNHWSDVVRIMDTSADARWIGMGRGVFPRAYHAESVRSNRPLTRPELTQTGARNFITFRPGADSGVTFLRQRFEPADNGLHRLKIELRAPPGKRERILIEFCERHVLKYRAECLWRGINVRNRATEWIEYNVRVDLRRLGKDGFGPFTRPVDISVMNRGIRERIDIGSVRLYRSDGRQILRNADFRAGMDHWFFSYGNHLRWHIKNVFLHLYFEGGALGLLVFVMTMAVIGYRVSRYIAAKEPLAVLLASSFAGVLVVGMFDGLFDEPRITFLFVLLAWLSLLLPLRSISADFRVRRDV